MLGDTELCFAHSYQSGHPRSRRRRPWASAPFLAHIYLHRYTPSYLVPGRQLDVGPSQAPLWRSTGTFRPRREGGRQLVTPRKSCNDCWTLCTIQPPAVRLPRHVNPVTRVVLRLYIAQCARWPNVCLSRDAHPLSHFFFL